MKMILLGTGTSHGVPVVACQCKVCTSTDERDRRMRCAAFVTGPASILIDTGPEFRMQALRFGVTQPDAVLITHSHADHLNGLDDLRIFSHTEAVDPSRPELVATEGEGLPIYANANTIEDIKNRFDYIFKPVKEGGGKPKLKLVDCAAYTADNPLRVGGMDIFPVPLLHGTLADSGWLLCERHTDGGVHSIAYLTDCNKVPDASLGLVRSRAGILEHLVIDGLRMEPHSTHFSFAEALSVAERLQPVHTWLTHLTHDNSHAELHGCLCGLLEQFPLLQDIVRRGGSVEAAYDGLILET